MTDWKFTKRGLECALCQRAFAEGEPHVSSLAVEGEAIARIDACLACWKRRDVQAAGRSSEPLRAGAQPPAPLQGAHSSDLFWWRTRHSSDKPRGLALNLEALEALFFSLGSRTETTLRELRYVLCLILMRKRRLKIERVGRTERGEVLVVSRPRKQELHEVDVFDFSPEKIDELRGRLQEVFEQSDVSEGAGGGDAAQEGRDAESGEAESGPAGGAAAGDGRDEPAADDAATDTRADTRADSPTDAAAR